VISERAQHEIRHGEILAAGVDPELIWGWQTPAGRIRARRRAKLIETGAQLGPNSHVLEIGCGTGMFTEFFAQTGCSIIAVDISEALLKKAEERKLPNKRVHFLQKRFEAFSLESRFDAIIGSSILHHLELNEALPKIYELLKPNGIMSFAEPNMLNPQVFVERKLRSLFPYVSPDETAFVRWAFRNRLKKAGFQDIEIVPFDWLHPSVPEKLIGLVSRIGRVIERIPLLREFSGSLYIKAVRPSDLLCRY
jgi:2-polyprenyl-3-methyl-5-hydroxy-6-metoxy-1,4-benzoquinol methylase